MSRKLPEPLQTTDEMYANTHYPDRPASMPPIDPFSEAASFDPEEHPDGTPDPYAETQE